jgi:streptogramin lyase
MIPLLSAMTRDFRRSHRVHGRVHTGQRNLQRARLCLEALEDRTVPTTISIAGATLNEIGSPSAFISAGSGGLSSPWDITCGPDGNVYVTGNGGAVRRYNGTTGAYLNTFVSQGSGGLAFNNVAGLAFGPDGNLYVTSGNTNQVLEYSGSTGAFIRACVAAGAGGLINPRELTFGPDGNLYVTMWDSNSGAKGVMRYQGPQGSSPGAPLPGSGQTGANFIAPSTAGLLRPLNVVFGPDGNLYVGDGQAFGILRFNGTTGGFIDTFVPAGRGGLCAAFGMVFDADGRLDVTGPGHGVHRYDAQGNFIGDLLVDAVSASLSQPTGMTLDAQGGLLISCDSNTVARYDRGVMVSLSGASGTPVSVAYATIDGSALAGTDYYAQSGVVTFTPGQTSRLVLLATQEEARLDGTETFSVQLSNPTGSATIAASTATVTIVDPVRQFSVSDAAAIEGDHTAHSRGASRASPSSMSRSGRTAICTRPPAGGPARPAWTGITGRRAPSWITLSPMDSLPGRATHSSTVPISTWRVRMRTKSSGSMRAPVPSWTCSSRAAP